MPFIPDEFHPAHFHAFRPGSGLVHPFSFHDIFTGNIFVPDTNIFLSQ
jgi:hypothetical protein